MKKIITALGNESLNTELMRYEKYDVLKEDQYYQEALLSTLEGTHPDTIIVSGILQGQYDITEFAEKIKEKSTTSRILIITNELNEQEKQNLNDLGIYDILIDSEIEMQDVIEAIDREIPIVEKAALILREKGEEYIEEKEQTKQIMQKQEIIAINGTSGSGKSTIAAGLSKALSKNTTAKILLIDLDTLSGNIEEIIKTNKYPINVDITLEEDKRCGINYAADLISKNRFDTNVLEEIVIKNNGIDILTGNTSLHYCQNVLTTQTYNKILESAKEKYDFIIIDTSSNIFLDSTKWALKEATKILYVLENTNVNIKKAVSQLEIYKTTWGIYKEKIQAIINKKQEGKMEKEVIEKILKDIKIIGEIKQNEEENKSAYEEILRTINYIPKETLKEKVTRLQKEILEVFNKNNNKLVEVSNVN